MKRIILFATICLLCLSSIGCMTKEEQLSTEAQQLADEVEKLENEITSLKTKRDELKDEILDIKVEHNLAEYIITIGVERDLSLNFDVLEAEISVSKEFYNSVEVGDKLAEEYIMGNGDHFKGWFSIVVVNKEIR